MHALKLWEFARLFAAMAYVNLVFFHWKTKVQWDLFENHMEFNAAFSRWIPSDFVVQITVQMTKLNRLAKSYFLWRIEVNYKRI